ncbi:hypothetical protein IEQ34_005256 [Dendrobium chrysotoxum]|uniref:Interactor of constitutive active ROPs 3 n=1 Tax=Dendrobium chrysotoxum TaxID=161865 RepID=A0AAV7HCH5_DENCH|nr:hypothetical protein IEQ34_005256 [Dendrobium chrysotoxum]
MQANKSSRRASEPPHRISTATTRPSSLSKAAGADVDSTAGINQPRKISSYRSQKENEHQSHSSNSVLEKRRPSQITHLESQLGELQEELKRTKDQLASSESCRKRAQQEAEEAKMQLIIISSKFEDSQRQLTELLAAEDDRIHELRKISQERDKAWQSELVALQNQQSIDMAAWSSAIKERQKLKSEIEMFVRSEAAMTKQLEAAKLELEVIKEEIMEKNSAMERLKIQIAERKGAETKASGSSNETQLQLEKSKARVNELEDMVKKLQAELLTRFGQKGEQVNNNLPSLSANKLMDNQKTISSQTESQLESDLKEAKAEIANLKSKLVNKEADLRSISHMNKKLNDEIRAQVNQVEAEFSSKITQAAIDISELKVRLAEKDVELEKLSEENNLIKIDTGKKDMEGIKSYEAEMEAELRRVKLHSNQWRKAAETAAAILMSGSNGRVIERTGSLDPQYFYDGKNLMHSPNFDEIGGDPPRSKNHNVLAMIGGFWKKS